jgi:hypothetical protein
VAEQPRAHDPLVGRRFTPTPPAHLSKQLRRALTRHSDRRGGTTVGAQGGCKNCALTQAGTKRPENSLLSAPMATLNGRC